jgi:hypothetical protein
VDPGQSRRGKSALEWANPPKTKLYWRMELFKFGGKEKGIEKNTHYYDQ